jgi:diguanylate cyclase
MVRAVQNLDDELKTTTAIAKRVLPKMAEWKIPMTPENYHLWFEYSIGSNQELTSDIDEIIASKKHFTSEVNKRLYDEYLGNEQNKRLIEQVQKETQKIFKRIVDDILITNESTSDYGQKLKAYAQQLDEAKELSDVQYIVKDIMSDTHQMAAATRNLQDMLEEATTQAEGLRQQLVKTEREALIDALTGLHNRNAFDRKAKDLYGAFQKEGKSFSVIMLDIDFFKSFNDKHGHQTGDEVLRIVGSMLHDTLKGKDFPARYGGEEFVVLLPGTTLKNACIVAEQIKKTISAKNLKVIKTGESLGNITVSLGVSEINSGDTVDSVIARADKALYLAKDAGRNNVKSEEELKA